MNYKLVFRMAGYVFMIEAAAMLVPLIVSVIYGESLAPFALAIPPVFAVGFLMSKLKPENERFKTRDAFAATALSWLFMSLAGAVPFILSGCFDSIMDCIFESISGFTTTGATILAEVETLPRGIAFWRSFTHFIGGMGVLMFMLALVPSANASLVNLIKAESTGPSPGKIVPKISETARVVYIIYLGMTLLLFVLLLAAGLPVFDAATHAFSTAGTGGFSVMNASVGAYQNLAVEIIISVFMFLFGVNFTLYFYLLRRDFKQVLIDEELRLYGSVVIASILIITVNITGLYGSAAAALRHASFQVSSIITTAGFATVDYNVWPALSKFIIVILTLTGCCAGSTGGGIKLVRMMVLFKAARIEISKAIHPRRVKKVTVNGKRADDDLIVKVAMYCFVYFMIFIVSAAIIAVDISDLLTGATAAITMLSNVGPGLAGVGPAENFGGFSVLSKIVLSFGMLAGRLEFFPLLILFSPFVWIKGSRNAE